VRRVTMLATRTLHASGPTRPRRSTPTESSPKLQSEKGPSRSRPSIATRYARPPERNVQLPELLGRFSPGMEVERKWKRGKITEEAQMRNNTAIYGCFGVMNGSVPHLLRRSAVPQTRDGFAAAPKRSAICHFQT
jgi:hypothetical protein